MNRNIIIINKTKAKRTKIKTVFIFLIISCLGLGLNKISAQNKHVDGADTVILGQYEIIIKLPTRCIKTITNYEEGFFVTYTSLDTAILSVHYGSMVSKPLISERKCTIVNRFYFESEIEVITGFCLLNDSVFYNKERNFREMDFIKRKITIMYESVDKSKTSIYNNVLDNIKILKVR